MRNGYILVRFNKPLYGTIQPGIAGTLKNNGLTANPRHLCIFNKDVSGNQLLFMSIILGVTYKDKTTVLQWSWSRSADPAIGLRSVSYDSRSDSIIPGTDLGLYRDRIRGSVTSRYDPGYRCT